MDRYQEAVKKPLILDNKEIVFAIRVSRLFATIEKRDGSICNVDVKRLKHHGFTVGSLVITNGAASLFNIDVMNDENFRNVLLKYIQFDWGEVTSGDANINDDAIVNGGRIIAAYIVKGEKIWVITEHDRSVTTFLLPEEY